MITLLFLILFLGVFGEILGFAIKLSWGILKVVFTIIFLPVIILALAFSGAFAIAIPALLIIGIVALVKNLVIA